jgi:hypothetical protein
MINSLCFAFRFALHTPSLPDIPLSRLNQVRNVGFVILMVIIIATGCKPITSDSQFMQYIPTNDINDKIKILQPPTYGYDTTNQCVDLLVINNSSDLIRFPIGYGIRLFIYNSEKKEWTEIRNRQEYSVSVNGMDPESSKKVIETQGGLPLRPNQDVNGYHREISYCPDLDGYQYPVTIRSLIVGTIFQDNKPTNNKVAAYYDLTIEK